MNKFLEELAYPDETNVMKAIKRNIRNAIDGIVYLSRYDGTVKAKDKSTSIADTIIKSMVLNERLGRELIDMKFPNKSRILKDLVQKIKESRKNNIFFRIEQQGYDLMVYTDTYGYELYYSFKDRFGNVNEDSLLLDTSYDFHIPVFYGDNKNDYVATKITIKQPSRDVDYLRVDVRVFDEEESVIIPLHKEELLRKASMQDHVEEVKVLLQLMESGNSVEVRDAVEEIIRSLTAIKKLIEESN